MLKRERQAYILHQVNLHNKVLSNTLSSQIAVSEDTIRRDLHELSETGQLIKIHGGALSQSFSRTSSPQHSIYAQTDKRLVARKAAALVQDGMFVLTGGGTTIIELARALPASLSATFVSGSIPAIVEYMNHPNIEVIVLGDKVSKASRITVGADALARIKSLKADICFLGVNAINLENGITDNDWDVVQLKQEMIRSSRKVVCLSISEKINSLQPIHVCAANQVDILITELDPGHPMLQPYVAAGITVL